jgi:hypothetical protein
MKNTSSLQIPFERLSLEARALFFIYASAALARYQSHRPKPAELEDTLEAVWDTNGLAYEDLADPFRMTRLLERHFTTSAPVPRP